MLGRRSGLMGSTSVSEPAGKYDALSNASLRQVSVPDPWLAFS